MAIRKALLKRLIFLIESGDFNNLKKVPDKLFSYENYPRRDYVSPPDRSNYNYGYMDIKEIGSGTPNVW